MQHITKEFVLAGKATFTIQLPQGSDQPHYTFKVVKKEANARWPEAYFVKLLMGPDNENSFSYVGKLLPVSGVVQTTAKSKLTGDSFPLRLLNRILARVWAEDHAAYEQHGFATLHAGKCCRCGRKLTDPESIETGWGPECRKLAG